MSGSRQKGGKKRPAKARASMPAGAEAVRAERAAKRAAQAAGTGGRGRRNPVVDTGAGVAIIRASWAGTVLFILGAIVAAAVPDARLVVALLDVALFVGGCALFFWAYSVAVRRSRDHEIGLWSLFLLEDVAPSSVRRPLLAALAVEIAVALGTAWIAGPLAFGILAPVWALSCCGLWGAKYGAFGPRQRVPSPRSQRRGAAKAES